MPLDQSIVFDGAWRLYSGQVPFRDFNTPNGLVPMIFQTFFYKVFGVNWYSYCLHSSVFNGLFCILVFLFLRQLAVSTALSWFYGLLSGVVFYPPIGTPYMEQHGFFFLLLALYLSVKGSKVGRGNSRNLCWILVPICIGLSYLSKQIPALIGLPFIFIAFAYLDKKGILSAAKCYLTGALIFLGSCSILFVFSNMEPGQFKLYFFDLPSQIGQTRIGDLLNPINLAKRIFNMVVAWKLSSLILIQLIFFSGLCLLFFKNETSKPDLLAFFRRNLPEILYLEGLILICIAFCTLTNNEPQNGIPYIFISLGIAHSLLVQWIKEPKFQKFNPSFVSLKSLVAATLIAMALIDASFFNLRVNKGREVHSFLFKPGLSPTLTRNLPKVLEPLQWDLPIKNYAHGPQDFANLFNFLNKHKNRFFLFSDFSILYGLTRSKSLNPSLWFHDGLTIPLENSPEFKKYSTKLKHNLKIHDVEWVVLDNLVISKLRVNLDSCDLIEFGPFMVHRLCDNKERDSVNIIFH